MSALVVCKQIHECGHTWCQTSILRPGGITQYKTGTLYVVLTSKTQQLFVTCLIYAVWKFWHMHIVTQIALDKLNQIHPFLYTLLYKEAYCITRLHFKIHVQNCHTKTLHNGKSIFFMASSQNLYWVCVCFLLRLLSIIDILTLCYALLDREITSGFISFLLPRLAKLPVNSAEIGQAT